MNRDNLMTGARYRKTYETKVRWLFRQQDGSVLSEVIILMFVLAPLLYAVVVIGKFVDLRQQSVIGARYLAWEQSVGSEPEDATASVRQFLGAHAPEPTLPANADRSRLGMAKQRSGKARHRRDARERFTSTQVNLGAAGVATNIGVLSSGGAQSGGLEAAISAVNGGMSGTPSGSSLVQATLDVDIAEHAWLGGWLGGCAESRSGNACLTESSSIHVDDWSAADDDMAIERVRRMVPANSLQPLGKALSIMGRLPLFEELAPLSTAFGHVDMSVLPERREALNAAGDDASANGWAVGLGERAR